MALGLQGLSWLTSSYPSQPVDRGEGGESSLPSFQRQDTAIAHIASAPRAVTLHGPSPHITCVPRTPETQLPTGDSLPARVPCGQTPPQLYRAASNFSLQVKTAVLHVWVQEVRGIKITFTITLRRYLPFFPSSSPEHMVEFSRGYVKWDDIVTSDS